MKFAIIIPHYKNYKATAYSVAQFLKYKGRHEVDIIVINNSYPDESINALEPFKEQINIIHHTSNKLSSHGVALDMGMEVTTCEWVIAAESDSFPISNDWLDYYARLINEGYDCSGSLLKLSGGTYLHPAGALYRRSIWVEAWKYCHEIQYHYFPNMSMKETFACHTMVHHSILADVLNNPEYYVELSEGYNKLNMIEMMQRCKDYKQIAYPFHNGMGKNQESIHTYGLRNVESEVPNVLLDNKQKIIKRIGFEPGQWLCYWQLAMGYKTFFIPTETKWLPNRENQQQKYTLNEGGFKHIWAGSSFLDMKDTEMNDVYEAKKKLIDDLYETLPEHQKIKA